MLSDALRRIQNQSKAFDYATIKEVNIVDGRVECEVDLGLYDVEATAEMAGGADLPYALPRVGDTWLVALLDANLRDAWLIIPIATESNAGASLERLDDDSAAWTPRGGKNALIRPASGLVSVVSSKSITLEVAGLKFELKDGKVTLGTAAADAIKILDQALEFIQLTNQDLSSTTVATLLGPQPLILAPLFVARVAEITAARLLLSSIKG